MFLQPRRTITDPKTAWTEIQRSFNSIGVIEGINARGNAATKICATYRMHLVRRKYQRYWDCVYINRVFGKFWKIKQTRKKTHQAYLARYNDIVLETAKTMLQKYVKSDLGKRCA